MDAADFDRWTRLLAAGSVSRRRAVRGAAGAAVAVALGHRAGGAMTCRADGAPCDPRKSGQCCSGSCTKTGKKHKCKPTPGAFGCTVAHDVCRAPALPTRCPGNPHGMCVALDNGKPFCTGGLVCFDCVTDADCNQVVDGDAVSCIQDCPTCARLAAGACVFTPPTS